MNTSLEWRRRVMLAHGAASRYDDHQSLFEAVNNFCPTTTSPDHPLVELYQACGGSLHLLKEAIQECVQTVEAMQPSPVVTVPTEALLEQLLRMAEEAELAAAE